MIFRWSIWGNHTSTKTALLRYSISLFQKQFGQDHQYIIDTDNPESLKKNFDATEDVKPFLKESAFFISSQATWMKWCPSARLDIHETEVYVDSDVFLLKYPKEIDDLVNNPKFKFGIMDEFYGQPWQHGAMQRKADKNTPFVNAGFFVQKAGFSISKELLEEFDWWNRNISKNEQTHHDEQGALAVALTKYSMNGELYIFPKEKYMLIGPNENVGIENLDDVTMFHAVYPDHPAFYKFKKYLDKILNN